MASFAYEDFRGVSPVLYAFWDEKERLHQDLMRQQVEQCLASGAHGITVLGLVTEVHKMSFDERLELVRCVGKAIDGRAPYSVTVGEPSVAGQIKFIHAAADAGADWVILQPPPTKGVADEQLADFFQAVAQQSPLPVAIQNNPINLDVYLSNEALIKLATEQENICLMKGEGPALHVAKLAEAGKGTFKVFAGHGGVEFQMNHDSGCVGVIPAPELIDRQVEVFDLFTSGSVIDRQEALKLHTEVLPWIVMMTRSGVETMIYFGKQLMAKRMGVSKPVFRTPCVPSNHFGMSELDRMYELLGKLKS